MPRKCRKRAAAALALCAIFPALAIAQANPLARATPGAAPQASLSGLNGRWNGAYIEQRSGCTTATNNGFHGTYAEWIYDVTAGFMTLTANAVNGLHCTFSGPLVQDAWSGEVSCSDGRTGTYSSRGFVITPNEISTRLSIQLTGSETCSIDAIMGGSRF